MALTLGNLIKLMKSEFTFALTATRSLNRSEAVETGIAPASDMVGG